MSKFKKELTELINKHSLENGSDTPDYILAEFLERCLSSFDSAVLQRDYFMGKSRVNNVILTENNDTHQPSCIDLPHKSIQIID